MGGKRDEVKRSREWELEDTEKRGVRIPIACRRRRRLGSRVLHHHLAPVLFPLVSFRRLLIITSIYLYLDQIERADLRIKKACCTEVLIIVYSLSNGELQIPCTYDHHRLHSIGRY